jgi:dCTP deaminase
MSTYLAKYVRSTMEIKDNLSKSLLFELIERIVRFYQHLDKVQDQFFTEQDKFGYKASLISSYKECLNKIFEIGIGTERNTTLSQSQKLEAINECIKKIKHLHITYLGHLPRPSEPNELKRFNRIINKQIDKFNNAIITSNIRGKKKFLKKDISIYMSESFGEETFNGDPLSEFKKTDINYDLLKGEYLDIKKLDIDESKNNSYHIIIPRIDTFNACKWPTLLHELGHHLWRKEFFNNTSIDSHFKSSLDNNERLYIKGREKIINLNNWLTECWCDLFAAATMGPAFWFSQFSSFIFNGSYSLIIDKTGKYSYPFPEFRLKLIKRILSHRLKNSLATGCVESMVESEMLISTLDLNFEDLNWIKLFILFEKYFLQYFFTKDSTKIFLGGDQFNDQIEPLLKYTKEIDTEIIDELVNDLSNNLPISTKRLDKKEIFEHPNSVQEILLAAWIFRNTKLRSIVFKSLENVSHDNLHKILNDEILKAFTKFDNSILKSVQVTEWVALFSENIDLPSRMKFVNDLRVFMRKKEEELIDNKNVVNPTTLTTINQLVDFEIFKIIEKKELRIIPLIDPKQIGTTSIDIRLGTSFQFYFPNQLGILDYIDQNSIDNTEVSTKTIDLDFLDSVTISPKQFILGHSMEYLSLPDTLSAELDGRSSFARSGLQIHMTAGFVEPGFAGVLTFEFFNAGPNSIRLFPGMRIGQLRFIPVNEPAIPYSKKRDAKYKGLLSHNRGLQSKDDEVNIILKAIESKKSKANYKV